MHAFRQMNSLSEVDSTVSERHGHRNGIQLAAFRSIAD